VAAHGVEVDAESLHINRDLAERLDAIHVQQDAGFARDDGDFGDGLERAELVVGVHDGDQHGLGAQLAADVIGVDHAARGHSKASYLHAFGGELLASREHRGVFDGAVMTCLGPAGAARVTPRMAMLSASVPPAVKTIPGRSVDQRGKLAARGFESLFGALAEMVDARRVTIHLTETRHHRLQNFRSDGRGGVVVEVEALH